MRLVRLAWWRHTPSEEGCRRDASYAPAPTADAAGPRTVRARLRLRPAGVGTRASTAISSRTPTGPAGSTRPTTTFSRRRRAGELPRHREGRRRSRTGSGSAGVRSSTVCRRCVSWGATDVRVPDAAAVHEALPGDAARPELPDGAVRRMRRYARLAGRPWGISESAYAVRTAQGNYQYRAFGVPGLGLKRGLADDLVISPYATALAVMIDPEPPSRTCAARPARLFGQYGFYEALDYTSRARSEAEEEAAAAATARTADRPGVPRAPSGHDARRAGERAARRRDGQALPPRSARAGDRDAAAGAHAA